MSASAVFLRLITNSSIKTGSSTKSWTASFLAQMLAAETLVDSEYQADEERYPSGQPQTATIAAPVKPAETVAAFAEDATTVLTTRPGTNNRSL